MYFVFLIVVQMVSAMHFTNCLDCRTLRAGDVFMCAYDGHLPTTDPYKQACCYPGDPSEYC